MRATTVTSEREKIWNSSPMMCRAFDEWWKPDFACGFGVKHPTKNKFRFLPRHACSHARTFSLFYRSMLMHPTQKWRIVLTTCACIWQNNQDRSKHVLLMRTAKQLKQMKTLLMNLHLGTSARMCTVCDTPNRYLIFPRALFARLLCGACACVRVDTITSLFLPIACSNNISWKCMHTSARRLWNPNEIIIIHVEMCCTWCVRCDCKCEWVVCLLWFCAERMIYKHVISV